MTLFLNLRCFLRRVIAWLRLLCGCSERQSPDLAQIQILNSQGNPMTTATMTKGKEFSFPLAFDASDGSAVSVPAEVGAATSDPTIATAQIVNTPASGTTAASDALVVKAVAVGSVVITVSSGSVTATLDLTVEEAPLASIVIGAGVDITPPAAPVAGQ